MARKSDGRKGTKQSKSRVSVLVAANMDGSDKLPPLVIGKSKNPNCFFTREPRLDGRRVHRMKRTKLPLPVEYTHQKKAWMNIQIFNDWLIQVNDKMKRRRRKILILADNFTAHRKPPPMSNVRLQMLPENTTSICQPMDAGIIAALKKMFRYRAAEHKITMLDSGLKTTITLYRALIMLKHSWDLISPKTILNCFSKAFNLDPDSSIDEYNDDSSSEDDRPPPGMTAEEFDEYLRVDDVIPMAGEIDIDDIIDNYYNEDDTEEIESYTEEIPVDANSALEGMKLAMTYLQKHYAGCEFEAQKCIKVLLKIQQENKIQADIRDFIISDDK